VFRIKRDPAKLVGSAVARSTQTLSGSFVMRLNKTYRPLVLGILLLFAWALRTAAQARSPLLDEIVVSVRKANPKWHFVNAVCTCQALVPSQSSYVAGGWYFRKLTSRRHMSVYISYVPTSAAAAEWMAELGRWNLVAGSHREAVNFADEAYLLTSDTGYAILNVPTRFRHR
jgi:hypothetical protein